MVVDEGTDLVKKGRYKQTKRRGRYVVFIYPYLNLSLMYGIRDISVTNSSSKRLAVRTQVTSAMMPMLRCNTTRNRSYVGKFFTYLTILRLLKQNQILSKNLFQKLRLITPMGKCKKEKCTM